VQITNAHLPEPRHQHTSSRCRYLHATAQVTALAEAGLVDPHSMRRNGGPATWTALRSGNWRTKTIAVDFPH
jgi:hypothetical protein